MANIGDLDVTRDCHSSRMLKESLKYFNIIQAKQLQNSHLCYIIIQCTKMSKYANFDEASVFVNN